MLRLAVIFLVIALVAGVFALTNISTGVPENAEILFLAFMALFLVTFIGWLRFRRGARSRML